VVTRDRMIRMKKDATDFLTTLKDRRKKQYKVSTVAIECHRHSQKYWVGTVNHSFFVYTKYCQNKSSVV